MQTLDWEGIRPEYKKGVLFNVGYECSSCKKLFYNHHKTTILSQGEWRPTAISKSKTMRSYQLSTLYSPVGMVTWYRMYELYLRAQEEPDGMRGFTNLYLGQPYKAQGVRPVLSALQALKGAYKSGEVPKGVLFLTAAIDVQAGQKTADGKPPRLVIEVCGHGKKFRTWSIAYRELLGPVDDISGGAWQELTDWFVEIGGSFYRSDGMRFPVSQILVDSGYNAHIVYDFCRLWQWTLPVKGYSLLKKNKREKGLDEAMPDYFRRYRLAKIGDSREQVLAEVSTNYYKHHIYNNLAKPRNENSEDQRPGFCEFPRDYPDEYFEQLRAEERRADHSFYLPTGRANEALDCRVYNMAAGDIFVDKMVTEQQTAAKQRGLTDLQVRAINHVIILEELDRRVNKKISTS
jgi:phage terminase large subunit GpA-like protein